MRLTCREAATASLLAVTLATALAATGRHPVEPALANAVAGGAMLASVRELVALGPRMGGTPSGDRAAAWLEGRFKALGLSVEVAIDPPLLASWNETWEVRLASGERLTSAHPYRYSPSLSPGDYPVLAIDDLSGVTPTPGWTGRLVFTRGPVREALARMYESPHRPAAVVTSGPRQAARDAGAAAIGSLPPRPDNPFPVFAVSLDDGEQLAAAAREGRAVSLRLESRVAEGQPQTVVATLAGRAPDKYVLFSAHGDSDAGGPGADDNASGVAAVVELARVFATLASTGAYVPPVSLKFAVWGAEYHSSRAFVGREASRLGACLAVINFDQVGAGAARDAVYFEGNDVPWNAPLLQVLAEVGRDYHRAPGFWPEWATNPSQGGTDSYAFLPRRFRGEDATTLEIPAVTIYTAAWGEPRTIVQTPGWEADGQDDPRAVFIDYSSVYHSSGDVPEKTTEREPANMERAVKAAGIGLLRFLKP